MSDDIINIVVDNDSNFEKANDNDKKAKTLPVASSVAPIKQQR